jgi:hypothetical protein
MSIAAPAGQQHHSSGEGRIALLALLMVQVVVGYEWLMSGLAKVARSGFVSGLASDLRAQSPSAHWYKSFLNDTVIPNSHFFAYLIIVGELAVGVTFIIAAGLWLWRWERLPATARMGVLAATALAALAAILMNISFHLAGGASHPWVLPKEGFNEGVDLDSLMPLLQFILLVVSTDLLIRLRRTTRQA